MGWLIGNVKRYCFLSIYVAFVTTILLFSPVQTWTDQLYAESNLEPAQRNSNEYPATPEGVVEAFCKEDYLGAGSWIGTGSWYTIQKYTTWPDAPGWDIYSVVAAYRVINGKTNLKNANVRVNYEIVGELESGERVYNFKKKAYTESITYELIMKDGKWKIDKPQEQPHISISVAIQKLERDPTKELNAKLIKQVNRDIAILKDYLK